MRLADNRMNAYYCAAFRDSIHPMLAHHAVGSKVWDIDGNEMIDIAGGFGPLIFGHNPRFVNDRVVESIQSNSFTLGIEHILVAENARRLCEMVAQERAHFVITGTEAVILAVRLARCYNSRQRIVTFEGSYHGHGDELLGQPSARPDHCFSVYPGITNSKVKHLTVLKYGTEESLQYIEEHASSLAMVLVEPVQSRNPGLQPHTFLHRLRAITAKADIVLLFDEVITGFRIAPGGAQEFYGVKADLVTYGKAIGGGYIVAAVAGRADIMALMVAAGSTMTTRQVHLQRQRTRRARSASILCQWWRSAQSLTTLKSTAGISIRC
jgi:iturin family lipopeptide synthetase A